GKRLVELNIGLEAEFVQQRLHYLPPQSQAEGEARVNSPAIVDVSGPFLVLEIRLSQRHGDDRVVHIAQHVVGAGVPAGLRGGSGAGRRDDVGELVAEKELAAGEFVSDLRKMVDPVLSAHAQRVLAFDPGEVVHELEELVVALEWAAGGVAETGQVLG